MELIFQEGGYLIKTLSTHEEMEAAFGLRHEVFVDELKWVPPSPDGMEKDGYDSFADSLGVFDAENKLVGYVRSIPAPHPFMIEKEFAGLLPKDKPFRKLPDMAEATRICVKKEYRTVAVSPSLTVCHLIYKAIYQLCLKQDMRYLAAVAEKRTYRYFKAYLPFIPMGDFLSFGDGVTAGIVLLDWRNFELFAMERKPEFFQWMVNLPPLVPLQWLQHAPY